MIDLRSDNTLGCSPEILESLTRASRGAVASYGNDPITERLRERCRTIFETELDIIPVATGTAANSLALAAMSPPWGGIFCHADAHIQRDELGAPEFFTGGAKIIPIDGESGKLHVDALKRSIEEYGSSGRMLVPAALSLTQATEAGTTYSVNELRELSELAHAENMLVHVDGARFANAFAAQSRSLADFSWRSGIDVLVFGATKNGAMASELLVIFRRDLTDGLTRRLHRSGHRFSKMRFLSAQLDSYLENDLWLRNARQANEAAGTLAHGLSELGIEILRPVQANIVFARLDPATSSRLSSSGVSFYDWPLFGDGAVRMVTGWNTEPKDIQRVIGLAATE